MVNKSEIEKLVKEKLDENAFLVDVQVSSSNNVRIFVDSYDGFTIDRCVELSRFLEGKLDREKEDFDLQVSSPGLSESFKVEEQYKKNRGREVEIVTVDGTIRKGLLKEVNSDYILLKTSSRERVEGHKKKQLVVNEYQINFENIKSAKVVVSFK